jgi:hypothetical protein
VPLQELGSCQHTLIGDETLGIKGISGGERRRVGIGLQVRADYCAPPPQSAPTNPFDDQRRAQRSMHPLQMLCTVCNDGKLLRVLGVP